MGFPTLYQHLPTLSFRLKGLTQRPRILYGMDEEGGRPIFLQAHNEMALGGDGLPDYCSYNKELLIELSYEKTLN